MGLSRPSVGCSQVKAAVVVTGSVSVQLKPAVIFKISFPTSFFDAKRRQIVGLFAPSSALSTR